MLIVVSWDGNIVRGGVKAVGQWPYKGPFLHKMTHPNSMEDTIFLIDKVKSV
jgi:hypothetical protein